MISNELLRQKILDYAIHGELVENNKELEPINIEEEKENIPFSIPSNWKWVSLDKIGQVISGTSYDKSKISDSGIRILRGGNISNDKLFLYGDDVFLPNEYYSEDKQVQLGDIVLVASTGSIEAIGKPAIVSDVLENTQIGAFLRIVRTKKEYSKYIGLIFMSDYYRNQIRDLVKGMAINNIKNGYLLNMLIPLPPIEEQNKITSKVYELFELIEKKEKNDQEKENLKKVLKEKIINNAIHGCLVKNDESLIPVDVEVITDDVPFAIPSNWNWSCFGKMANKITDGAHSTPKYCESGIPFLSVKDMSDGKLHFDNCKYISEEEHNVLYKRCDPKRDDLLITKVGTTGVPVIVDVDFEFSLFVSVALLRFNQEKFINKYLKYVVESRFVQNIIDENTKGMANKNWVIKKIAETPIPVPPLEEQKRIVEKIDSLFELIEQL